MLLMLFLAVSLGNSAQAQIPEENSVSVVTTPLSYGPNETVTITLGSYSVNLDTASIVWLVNGRNLASGIGRKVFTTTSGASGTLTKVMAKISLPEGELQKIINIRPASSTLLWEARDSHVPPFYKGKALPSKDSEIKVVAMPEIKLGSANIDPKTLIYNWKKDYSNEAEASGYGKTSFSYTNDFLENSNNVEVMISTPSGERSEIVSINIGTTTPEIIFYSKDSALGTLWEKSIKNGYMVRNGETLQAVPYFISPKDVRRPDVVFNWFVNGLPVSLPSYKKTFIPLGIQPGTSGTSILRLEIENTDKIFQSVKKEVELQF